MKLAQISCWSAKVKVFNRIDLKQIVGRLVAILPAIATRKFTLPDCEVRWSQVFANEFIGTSINVVIMTAVRTL